ncbi:hypothetical protein [Lysobacter sp. CFH 32150]|uniref:hypothetical protein n=1 Tax=Lysobacter sp. CFH 32150 TaxID=2927128 RepID=UPI001FA7C52C|nr:hypothetical protein [Lysobacter sp. CFH 32150]MCI4568226.1 hypothetical protein [Lysobacter sp. CFH 32150]
MSFKKLIAKVEQAEHALEAQERAVAADWRQLKGSWKDMWTPGRIIVAGLVGGFLIARTDPIRGLARSGGLMQLATTLTSLLTSGIAKSAASEAEHAAASAEDIAAEVAPDSAAAMRHAAQTESVEP